MHHNLIIKDGDTTKVAKEVLVDGVQFVDEKPLAGSTNPVTSGGVASAITDAVGGAVAGVSANFAPEYAKTTYPANSYVMHDGILYTNPYAIVTAEDWNPAHWVQTTVANMIAFVPNKTALIGGREYRTVQIGEQIWLAENLDYQFSGCEIGAEGSPNTPAAWYYNDNEPDYGIDGTYKCGLLYNWHAVKALNDNRETLCPGWHVPTNYEWTALVNTIGGTSTAGTKLKALNNSVISGWPSGWNGADNYGFAALPTGGRASNSFANLGSAANFWTVTEATANAAYRRRIDTGASINTDGFDKTNFAFSVRLVKD